MRLPRMSLASALTPENVPTPPAAAQAPELSPFDTEIPLPPSTSGRTSSPDIRIVLREITRSQAVPNSFAVTCAPPEARRPPEPARRVLTPATAQGRRH